MNKYLASLTAFLAIFLTACATSRPASSVDKTETGLSQALIEASAKTNLYLAEFIATDEARKNLYEFRTGEHNGNPKIYLFQSVAQQELLQGRYYQELTRHLISEMADWYGGEIPANNGLFIARNSFRPFGAGDALWGVLNGIDMADIIGSITYHVRMTTKQSTIHFLVINDMSIESYAGENYFKIDLVDNVKTGALSPLTQVFKWQLPIPVSYQKKTLP